MKPKHPRPPQHLLPSTRKWWTSVVTDYVLADHHVLLLTGSGSAWDRAEEAREAVAKDGPYFTNRHGEIKPHPGIAVERDNRALFAKLLRELDLDVEAPPSAVRAPELRRFRGGK